MSQIVTSRPVSMALSTGAGLDTGVPKLPQIEHPLSRMSNMMNGVTGTGGGGGGLEMRGVSRASTRSGAAAAAGINTGRPLPSEEEPKIGTLHHSGRRLSRSLGRLSTGIQSAPHPQSRASHRSYEVIPEGVSVVEGDPCKTRLPIFGNRASVASRVMSARDDYESARLQSATQSRLEMDELEVTLREKLRGRYFEMRKRFVDNDPEQKGNVSRDALLRILVGLAGRPISHSQLTRLFERLSIRPDKTVINFSEFFTAFNNPGADGPPRWMDPVQRGQDKVTMNSQQVHEHLREKIRQKFFDLGDLFPQVIEGGSGRLLKSEFRNGLSKMLFIMDDSEFEKLWQKYDPQNTGAINGVNMLRLMGITMRSSAKKNAVQSDKKPRDAGVDSKRTPRNKKEAQRARSLLIEQWLKDKFREGFHSMRAAFEAQDPGKTGVIPHESFLSVLEKFGLSLDKRYLKEFLARCAVELRKDGGVPYRDFLHRFQDRSEAGMTHKILSDPYHSYNDDNGKDKIGGPLSSLEAQLMNMFQRDFLSLLGTFRKIDRHNLGVLSQEEFRAAMESKFQFELTDEQFAQFVDRLPLNHEGLVKYSDFMKQFDTTGLAPSLFKYEDEDAEAEEVLETGYVRPASACSDPDKRDVRQTWGIIKNIFDYHFQELEHHFYDIDIYNSGRLTQEQMYQLLKRFKITPEISRGEIRDLWKCFILRNKQSLDYKEFCRAFIYNPSTSSFPNAKVVPPKLGDSDLMPRSKKLNGVAILLEDNLRSKVDYMWDALRAEFSAMDPYGTGFVTKEEFQEVIKELSVFFSDNELDDVTKKFAISNDGRVSYVEFLRPFAAKRQTWRHGNNLLSLLQQPGARFRTSAGQELSSLAVKLQQADMKGLRRAFKKLDSDHTGYLSLPEFRSVLKLVDIDLDDEECFQMMSKYDNAMTGRVPYTKILHDAGCNELFHQKKKNTGKRVI